MYALMIAGPSAVGKTTVASELLRLRPDVFSLARSATTRAPRGDGHDDEYIYLTVGEFLRRCEAGEMLEYTEFGGNYYGTPLSEINAIRSGGRIPLLILDINGISAIKSSENGSDCYAVYLTEDIEVLDKRLYERAEADGLTEKALATYERRRMQNRRDLADIGKKTDIFDRVAVNRDVGECARLILSALNV